MSVTPEHPQGISCMEILGETFIPNVDKLSPSDQKKLMKLSLDAC